MAPEDFKRKLTAIFSADVAGYSRLMGDDESATVRTLETYKQVMYSLIRQHRGRLIDSPGDNLLAEFASVVDAVQCGVAVQKELQNRNADLPEKRRMQFRIGINLGDVIEEGDRIYGDGVNIAARLEALADPGGICVSKTAFDHIEAKLPLGYHFLGEQTVKNIAKPVGAYKVLMEPRVTGAETKGKAPKLPLWQRKAILAVGVAVALVIIAALVWRFYFRPPPIEPASVEKMAYPLPDKPSIAVLPFKNLSGDPQQDPLSNAITENIITALSKTPKVFVIASNSVSIYKDKPVKVQQLSEELGVRYILDGSALRSENRLRISAHLIDAIKGRHIWAEKYDRTLNDIFAVQDEITMKIIAAMQLKITEGEQARLYEKGTDNLEAYLKILQSIDYRRHHNPEDNAKARQLAQEAIVLDPHYPMAYAVLGRTHYIAAMLGSKPLQAELRKAETLANKALSLDDSLAEAHSLLGHVYLRIGDYDKAITEYKRAVELNPTGADDLARLARGLRYVERHEEAISLLKKAIRLNPNAPSWYFNVLCGIYRDMGNYREAIAWCKKQVERDPKNFFGHLDLCSTYSLAGRMEEARAEAAEALRIKPKFSVAQWEETGMGKDPDRKGPFLESLRKAGLPETPPLPLPDKPSIAVLPFVNMSGDPGQEYFSDGMTEEIITALSKSQRLFVVARESTFSYKGKSIQIPMVGRELGVRYVLEGSVRMAENQVRITAQLIDAATGNHLWAERYDRELRHIFAIQDDITKKIVGALQVRLTDGEQARLYEKGTDNLQAFLKCLQGREYMYHFSREGIDRARPLLKEAIALDPDYAAPYRWLGGSYMLDVMLAQSKNPKESLMTAIKLAQKAISLDDSFVPAYCLLAQLYAYVGKHDEGVALAEHAVSINPNSADAHNYLGHMLNLADRPTEAIPELKKGIRLNPIPPKNYLYHLAMAYMGTKQYEEAIVTLRKVLDRDPNDFLAHLWLTIIYSNSDREKEARAEAAEVLRINPKFRVEKLRTMSARKNREITDRSIEALRKAGLK